MDKYYGNYFRFEAISKKDAAILLGSDCIVGDIFTFENEIEEGKHRSWIVNKFQKRIGYLNEKDSKKISLLQAEGLDCKAILSFVAFSDSPDEGHYWGEIAAICYSPAYADDFVPFVQSVAKSIGDDVRPQLSMNESAVSKIIESHGEWMPSQKVSIAKMEKGNAILKRRRSVMDKVVEQGRSGNKGCYVVSWLLLLAIVTLVLFCAHSCGLF